MRGLGDLVAWFLKPLQPLIRRWYKTKDCGCKKRQNALNEILPFKPRPMTEDEILAYKERRKQILDKINKIKE